MGLLISGGFSKDFMQASWQADAVNAYFNSGVALPSEDYYKPGRAYPGKSSVVGSHRVLP